MSTTTFSPIVGPAALSPEWYEQRRKLSTSTDVARIMSGEAYSVWCEKVGLIDRFQGNEFTEVGQILEEPILQLYERREQCKVRRPLPLLIDPETLILAATPDAERIDVPAGVEAKSSISRQIAEKLGEEESDRVPEGWQWQTQVQMAVTGWEWVDVAVLLFGRLKVYRVARNEKLIKHCRQVAVEMHERVERRDPPAIDFNNTAAQEAIRAMYGVNDGATIVLSEVGFQRWIEYQNLSKQAKSIDDLRKACQAEVLAEMKDAALARLGNGFLLSRNAVHRKAYTVAESTFIQLRQRKE
jgi:putative phage-type endonuclease